MNYLIAFLWFVFQIGNIVAIWYALSPTKPIEIIFFTLISIGWWISMIVDAWIIIKVNKLSQK